LGDSITEGGKSFQCYRYPLWEKLYASGYFVEFVGPRSSACRIGKLKHAGYGGKTVEFLDKQIDAIYEIYPADIVLLHAGHNHFQEEKPVAGIITAHKSIIRKLRAINPKVKILVAQVITSGKLPKYAYIPELNKHLEELVSEIHTAEQPVILVNQAEGFNWQKDTVGDKVHPNGRGAEKMAGKWLDSLVQVLDKPTQAFKPEIVSYKKLANADLKLHIFKTQLTKTEKKRPVIIFFFAGGWTVGTPLQFYRECAHYASKGMVAVSAEYRIESVHKTTPFESVSDAKSAIRWLRENAEMLNIDPNRIAAAGASAGGHVAAAAGTVKGFDEANENMEISSRPNLLLLYYAVIDNGPKGYGSDRVKGRYREISPIHNIDSDMPPCLFVLGTKDSVIPVATAKAFKSKMEKAGVNCTLHLYKGAGHPIFYYREKPADCYYRILTDSDEFLKYYGYIPK